MNAVVGLERATEGTGGPAPLAVRPEGPSTALTPMQMVYQLISSGASLDSVKEMIAVSRELADDQKRNEFEAAISAAKAELTPVIKNRKGHTGTYADFAAVAIAVDPIISKFGLSYRHRSEQTDKISVTCILSHKAGHREETTLSGGPDTSGSKNAIQAIGSTLTYLQRYTLLLALGLSTTADDDGKAAGDGELISMEQVATLSALITETKSDIAKFCKVYRIEALAGLPLSKYEHAIGQLNSKKATPK